MKIFKERNLEKRFKVVRWEYSNTDIPTYLKASNLHIKDGVITLPTKEVIKLGDYMILDGDKIIGAKKSMQDVYKSYKEIRKFTKADRSNFKYWFAHWCGFQLVSLNLKVWKPKFLFHDIEKPWLKLFWSYKKVQRWHRKHNAHHMEYGILHGFDKVDWIALIIDYECSRYSKLCEPLDTRQTLESMMKQEKWIPYEKEIRSHIEPIMLKLGL